MFHHEVNVKKIFFFLQNLNGIKSDYGSACGLIQYSANDVKDVGKKIATASFRVPFNFLCIS